jgi:asparagine synthase (glutamine-hydrolysing)
LYACLFEECDSEEWLDVVLGADVNLYLPDDLLVKMDRATMANSLEARSPFLDHVVMEFVASLPAAFKQGWGQKKRILKTMLRGRVPDRLLDRQKMGFTVPLAKWFRTDLRETARDVLLSSRASQRGYFGCKEIARLLDEHMAGADHGGKLWNLLMLELWHETFVDGGPAANTVNAHASNWISSLATPEKAVI